MNSKILFYKLEQIDHYTDIQTILNAMKIELICIPNEKTKWTLAALLGLKEKENIHLPYILNEPMMIFFNLTSQQIDFILQAFKQAGIPFIPLKVMVTPTNLNWSCQYLQEHIQEEYAMMSGKKHKNE